MVSISSEFTEALLEDVRFRNERQAAARRGAANYKNLESLAQKFWKSQEPRMPDVYHRKHVLLPINSDDLNGDVSIIDEEESARRASDVHYKGKVWFADDTPPLKPRRESRIKPAKKFESVGVLRSTIGDPTNVRTTTKEITKDRLSKKESFAPVVAERGYQLQNEYIRNLQDLNRVPVRADRKRMRTYQKKSRYHDHESNSLDADLSTFSLLDSESPRVFFNQRRRKINMQFTSNNGQVTVIEPTGDPTQNPQYMEAELDREERDQLGNMEFMDELELDSMKLFRENTVAVLKRVDVMLHGPDKPPVTSELGSSVRETAQSSEIVDVAELYEYGDLGDIQAVPDAYYRLDTQNGDVLVDDASAMVDLLNDPSLCSKLDVYVKCENWLDRWFTYQD